MIESEQHASEPAQSHAAVSAASSNDEEGLVSQLRLIEDQPLETRASAYAQLHEQLQARLEGGDTLRARS